jgi:hypothetical protein
MQNETETLHKTHRGKRRGRWRWLRTDDPMLGAIRDVIDWALDIAVKLAEGDDEAAGIEDVRRAFHAWITGARTDVDTFDLYITLGTILARIESELEIDAIDLYAHLAAQLETRDRPRMLRCPGHRPIHPFACN